MRFFLLNQFYPPDPAPTGTYLHGLARTLVKHGHEVTVFCSRKSYDGRKTFSRRETVDGVRVHRLPAFGLGRNTFIGKMVDYTSFYLSITVALIMARTTPDMILSLTTPPYIGLLGKLASWWHKCRHAHWIMDLYPDVMFAHGMAHRDGLIIRLLQKLTRLELQGACSVFALGPAMAARLNDNYLIPNTGRDGFHSVPNISQMQSNAAGKDGFHSVPNIFEEESDAVERVPTWFLDSIPLWSDPDLRPWPNNEPNPLRQTRNWSSDNLVFLYSGNMGLGHRFQEFLAAAHHLGAQGPRWVFAGQGKRRTEIEAFAKAHPGARIELLDYVPHAKLRAHLSSADVHVASLDPAWEGLMVPSKLQASFAVGRPVIFVGSAQGDIATWIKQSGGGWVIEASDIPGLLEAIQQASDKEEREQRGKAAFAFAQEHFRKSENCQLIAQILEEKP